MADREGLKKFLEKKNSLKRRILELNETLHLDLAFAFERLFEARAYTYFATEEKLRDFEALFEKIAIQVDEATDTGDLTRVAERLAYVEERLDEFESRLYNRPRRKRP
ncbi:MAG TPA: hypothetical protein VIK48_01020, partial [Candidatus Manganitrophaceae bacterium]